MNEAPAQILLIDDSPTVLCFARLILQSKGYCVHMAEDGEQGLSLAKKIKPDAIFIDYVLPNMSGHTFCQLISHDDTLQDTPLILMTSKGDNIAEKLQAEFSGMRYLAKPFEPDELLLLLECALTGD